MFAGFGRLANALACLVITSVSLAFWSQPAAAQTSPRATVVHAFDHTPVYFTEADNQRDVTSVATFPSSGSFQRITLHIALDCPAGGCDPWDRYGTIGVVTAPATDTIPASVIELARFMTPYGVGARWTTDVTDLRPLLKDSVTLRASIDTWVGPGNSAGAGWQLTTWFTMVPGRPARTPLAVLPVWDPREVLYGDPAKPIGMSAPPVIVALPAQAKHFALRSLVTGHGQGNSDDCSEFCPRTHTLRVNGFPHRLYGWRPDCATSHTPHQRGNYWYSRALWCPGDVVQPWLVDVSSDVAAHSARIAYSVSPYVNKCRPGAVPMVPTECVLGTSAEYDGGRHTPPVFRLSTVLIAYE